MAARRTALVIAAIAVASGLVIAGASRSRDVRAHVVPGEYSMEVAVNETSVGVGGTFVAYLAVRHNGGPYQAAQWHLDYSEGIIDAGTIAVDTGTAGACAVTSQDDNGSRVLAGCLDAGGANIRYSGNIFRVQFTCVGQGPASLTLNGATFVDGGASNPPIHVHNDNVTCGSGSVPPAPPPPPTPAPGQRSCTVAEVLTGDSFTCTDGTRVRMLQVDAQDPGQCGGGWAKAALAYIFLPPGRAITLDYDTDRSDGADALAAPIVRAHDGNDYNISIVMVYVGLAKAASVGTGNTKYRDWANAAQVWASVAQWNMWAPEKTYTGGCD